MLIRVFIFVLCWGGGLGWGGGDEGFVGLEGDVVGADEGGGAEAAAGGFGGGAEVAAGVDAETAEAVEADHAAVGQGGADVVRHGFHAADDVGTRQAARAGDVVGQIGEGVGAGTDDARQERAVVMGVGRRVGQVNESEVHWE